MDRGVRPVDRRRLRSWWREQRSRRRLRHYEGRAVDVFFRPLGDREQHRRGWVFAQWLVAHAADHHVLSVIYDDRIWTSWAAGSGWRDYVHPGATFAHRGNAVLRHKDHVHVAAESGRPYTG